MATVTSKPRQRAWKPKTRTGCKTRKVRRVKCDEEYPLCKRCTSTGRTCDGYGSLFSRYASSAGPVTGSQTIQPSFNFELVRSRTPVYLGHGIRLDTREERESFDFFTSRAITSLRGFLDSPFWEREILQAAHHDPAIQHCVIALGAMYRRFVEGHCSHIGEENMSDKHLRFALRQSNLAILDLVRKIGPGRTSKKEKMSLITCSVLFINMFHLQGYQKDALEHLRSGIKMLNKLDQEDGQTEDYPIDVDSLRSIFVNLDLQARSIMRTPMPQHWVARPKSKAPSTLPKPKLNMSSLLMLLQYFECLLSHVHAFFQGTFSRSATEAIEVRLEYSLLVERFKKGESVLQALCDKATSEHDNFTQPLTALRLLHCQIEYFLQSPRADLEAKFNFISQSNLADDQFYANYDAPAQFTRLFDLATKLLPQFSTTAPVFTTVMGPISSLWIVVIRAPSSCTALRREAANLMRDHPRREGFWDGMLAGRIAQEMLDLEQATTHAELGLAATPMSDLIVPEDLRILVVAVTYP